MEEKEQELSKYNRLRGNKNITVQIFKIALIIFFAPFSVVMIQWRVGKLTAASCVW